MKTSSSWEKWEQALTECYKTMIITISEIPCTLLVNPWEDCVGTNTAFAAFCIPEFSSLLEAIVLEIIISIIKII